MGAPGGGGSPLRASLWEGLGPSQGEGWAGLEPPSAQGVCRGACPGPWAWGALRSGQEAIHPRFSPATLPSHQSLFQLLGTIFVQRKDFAAKRVRVRTVPERL